MIILFHPCSQNLVCLRGSRAFPYSLDHCTWLLSSSSSSTCCCCRGLGSLFGQFWSRHNVPVVMMIIMIFLTHLPTPAVPTYTHVRCINGSDLFYQLTCSVASIYSSKRESVWLIDATVPLQRNALKRNKKQITATRSWRLSKLKKIFMATKLFVALLL